MEAARKAMAGKAAPPSVREERCVGAKVTAAGGAELQGSDAGGGVGRIVGSVGEHGREGAMLLSELIRLRSARGKEELVAGGELGELGRRGVCHQHSGYLPRGICPHGPCVHNVLTQPLPRAPQCARQVDQRAILRADVAPRLACHQGAGDEGGNGLEHGE